jgi:uncharacterized RDD family membrane protein YckC
VYPADERDIDRDKDAVPAGLVLATIRRRAIGAILDQLIVLLPVAIGAVVWGFRPGDHVGDSALFVLNVSSALTALVYETLLVGFFGRTIGKIATGTRVVRRLDGGRVTWFAAGQRAIVPVAASAVPSVGIVLGGLVYAMALLGPLRQGLHDRAAGTLVIRQPRTSGRRPLRR